MVTWTLGSQHLPFGPTVIVAGFYTGLTAYQRQVVTPDYPVPFLRAFRDAAVLH